MLYQNIAELALATDSSEYLIEYMNMCFDVLQADGDVLSITSKTALRKLLLFGNFQDFRPNIAHLLLILRKLKLTELRPIILQSYDGQEDTFWATVCAHPLCKEYQALAQDVLATAEILVDFNQLDVGMSAKKLRLKLQRLGVM